MQILNRLKYASNSSVIDTVARVADSGRDVDSNGVRLLKEALGSSRRDFSDAERTYILSNLDQQYQSLTSKVGSVPEAALIAQELGALKSKVLSYGTQGNDSIVKRFREGIVRVVDGVGSSLKPAYAVAGLAALAAVGIIGGSTGCRDASAANPSGKNTNSIFQVSALIPVKPKAETKAYTAPVADPALKRSAEFIDKSKANFEQLTTGMDKVLEANEKYNAESEAQIKAEQEQNRELARRNNDLTGKLNGATQQLKEATEKLNKATRDYQQAQGELARTRKGYEEVRKGLDVLNGQVRLVREVTAEHIKTLEGKLKCASAANDALQTEVNGYRSAEREEREEARTTRECEADYKVGLARQAAAEKHIAPKPVQKATANTPSAKYDVPAAKNRALADTRRELDEERKPKMFGPVSTSGTFSITHGKPIYSGGVLNPENIGKSGAQISYGDNTMGTQSNPRVVRAIAVEKDETNPYRIDVQAPGFGDKNRQTRWERKEAQKKFDGVGKNPKKKAKDNAFVKEIKTFRDYTISPGVGSRDSRVNVKIAGDEIYGAFDGFKNSRQKLGYKEALDDFTQAGEDFFIGFGGPLTEKAAYKGTNPVTGTGRYLGRVVGRTFNFFGRGLVGLITRRASNRVVDPAISGGQKLMNAVVKQPAQAIGNLPRGLFPKKWRGVTDNVLDVVPFVSDFVVDSAAMVGIDLALHPEKGVRQGEVGKYKTWGSLGFVAGSATGIALGEGETSILDSNPISNPIIPRVVRVGSKAGGSGGR